MAGRFSSAARTPARPYRRDALGTNAVGRSPQRFQPFARGQGQPLQQGPFLGGYLYKVAANVAAAGIVVYSNNLRVLIRHIEVFSVAVAGEYPSRVSLTVNGPGQFTVKFESAQSAGAFLFVC